MDWKLDRQIKVFLSSTSEDLHAEREAVEAVVHRMSEQYVGMEHWGSFAAEPLQHCLQKVRDSDVMVLVLGERYGFVPPGATQSITELEYRAALNAHIPVLPYFGHNMPSGTSGADRALTQLKEEIRFAHGVSWFRSADHLASMVAADLARQVRTLLVDSLPFVQEVNPDLIRRHDRVNAELASGQWDAALELCDEILRLHPRSPRAHYNRACTLSQLCAQGRGKRRTGRLAAAQQAFVSAMENGIVQLVSLYLQSKDPFQAIHDEQALQYLFRKQPGLVTQYLGEDKQPRLSGFGAYGTCVAADMPVHLGAGGCKYVAELVPGEVIASWHPAARREVAGCVRAVRKSTASELVCINQGLRCTAAHPILTARGWLAESPLSNCLDNGVHLKPVVLHGTKGVDITNC